MIFFAVFQIACTFVNIGNTIQVYPFDNKILFSVDVRDSAEPVHTIVPYKTEVSFLQQDQRLRPLYIGFLGVFFVYLYFVSLSICNFDHDHKF